MSASSSLAVRVLRAIATVRYDEVPCIGCCAPAETTFGGVDVCEDCVTRLEADLRNAYEAEQLAATTRVSLDVVGDKTEPPQ